MSDAPVPPPGGLGALLQDARLAKGLDLSEVADRTHVRRSYLEALEAEDFSALPEDVYARNFLRLFARTVGVDPEEALSRFDAARGRASSSPRATRSDARAPDPAPLPPRRPAEPDAAPPPRARRTREPVPAGGGRAATAAPPRRGLPPNLMPLLMTIVLAGALVGVAVWGFNQLLFRPGVPAGTTGANEATAPDDAAGGIEVAPPPGGLAAPTTPQGDALPAEILLSVTSDPPGAEVSVDAFPLPGTTPIEGVPVTAREERTLRVTREGYEPFESTFDMTRDRDLSVTLQPLGAEDAAAGADDEPAAGAAPEGAVVVEVTEPTWLEAYASTTRGEGERLVYTTAQPGERFEFSRPLYLHVGNAAGLTVTVDGEPVGTLGSGGAVTGQAFPAP